MNMLLKLLGEEAFQKGIRGYLQTYLYGNATWDNLITILNKYTDKDLVAWSNSWVNEKGCRKFPLRGMTGPWSCGKKIPGIED